MAAEVAARAEKGLLRHRKHDEGAAGAARGQIAYERLLVPLGAGRETTQAMAVACRLAADRRAVVTALSVIEIEPELPLEALMPEEEAEARERVGQARKAAELYGVGIVTRVVRARYAGEAIVEEARSSASQVIVIATPRRLAANRHARVFGRTVDFVLKHAPCRVVVAAMRTGP